MLNLFKGTVALISSDTHFLQLQFTMVSFKPLSDKEWIRYICLYGNVQE